MDMHIIVIHMLPACYSRNSFKILNFSDCKINKKIPPVEIHIEVYKPRTPGGIRKKYVPTVPTYRPQLI